MSGFFEEVKRRKVYRVAAAYVIAAGGIIQLASAAFPAWELPNWALRSVIMLLLIGFPIALILAWAFDVTPQGIRATPSAPAPRMHRRRDLTDVFAIQTDLAKKITGELQAKLSPAEKAQMERKPTENGEAYLAFVQANNLGCALEDFDKLKQSEQLYDRAVQLDPNFAVA